MYISLKDSCANGFKKWADTHQPEIKHDLRASGGNGLARCHGRGLALDCDPFPLRTRVEARKRVELGDLDGPFRNRLGSLEMGEGDVFFRIGFGSNRTSRRVNMPGSGFAPP